MVRTWKIGATGSVLIGVALLAACSGSGEDDDKGSGGKGSGAGAAGGAGGTGGATGGNAGTVAQTGGTGGATGGAAGGSMGGSAGTVAQTGGTAGDGAAGSAGASGGAAGAGGPFTCKGTMATCNVISDFAADPAQWGSGDFHGGVSTFGEGIVRDASTTELKVTGMVAGYGRGFNLWFTYCSDLSAFTGVSFIAKGTAGMPTATAMPNIIQFQLQTNSNYPWQPFPVVNMKGGCTDPTGANPWGVCIAPSIDATLGDAPQSFTWAMMMGGMPTAWDAATSPKEIVGIQFQFPWAEGGTPYPVDVTLDDVKFTGAATETNCGTYMASGGAGGMGNAGAAGAAGAAGGDAGAAGAGGMAGAAGGGSGGAGAGGQSGAAGASAGGAGAGGAAAGGAGAGGAAAAGAGAGGMSGSN